MIGYSKADKKNKKIKINNDNNNKKAKGTFLAVRNVIQQKANDF